MDELKIYQPVYTASYNPLGLYVGECGCVQQCDCGECEYCIMNEGYGCGCE